MYDLAPPATGVAAGCFDLATVRRGRALQLLETEGGTDVVGLLPAAARSVTVVGPGGERVRALVRPGSYAARASFRPREVIVRFAKRAPVRILL